MNTSEVIAGIALLVSIASFAYGVRTVRQNRQIKGIEKRLNLLTSVTKFILMQEQIAVEATRLSRTSNSDQEDWERIAKDKLDMAKEMRGRYEELENPNSTDIDFFLTLESSVNNMLETAKCDLEWLQKAQSDINREQDKVADKLQD